MLSFEKFVEENPVCYENDDDNDDGKNDQTSWNTKIYKTSYSNNASTFFRETITKS